MHKIDITKGNTHKSYTAPESWEELSKKQLLRWCGVLRMELNQKEALTLAIYLLYKIPSKIFKLFNPIQDVELRDTMLFLTKNELTKNILGYISVLCIKYHGPANRLTNLTISEYRRTELYYDLYLKTGKKQFLYLLSATLFRPARNYSDNDIRCKLTEKGVAKRAKLFSFTLHPNTLMAIKLFYEGCRENIIISHPKIYKRSDSSRNIMKKRSPVINDLEDHILAYSGGKLGNFNETSETNLYVFLKHMSQRIEEYEIGKNKIK